MTFLDQDCEIEGGHQHVFEDHVNEIAEISKNVSFLSDEDFIEIVKFLKGQNSK